MIKDARHAHPELTVVRLCDVFSVSRTSFYGHTKGDHTDPDGELAGQIETVVEEYGDRRITRELARRGNKVN